MVATTLFYDPKSPEDICPYSLDFTQWMIPATSTTLADSIVSAVVSLSGSGLTATGSLVNGNVVTTILSGGTAGMVYLVHFRITTLQGLTVQRSVSLQVVER